MLWKEETLACTVGASLIIEKLFIVLIVSSGMCSDKWGIPEHLIVFKGNLYTGLKATVQTEMVKQTNSRSAKK